MGKSDGRAFVCQLVADDNCNVVQSDKQNVTKFMDIYENFGVSGLKIAPSKTKCRLLHLGSNESSICFTTIPYSHSQRMIRTGWSRGSEALYGPLLTREDGSQETLFHPLYGNAKLSTPFGAGC